MFHPDGPSFYELMVQAMSSTERGYDLLAPKFDYTPFRTPLEIIDAVGRRLEPLGPFHAGLDICCGTGVAMAMLRPLCTERVVGIDFSQGMLDVCRQQTAEAPGSARFECVYGDALHMPFDAEFDVAVCFGAHGHILRKDEDRFVREVARVLRPGGRFVFVSSGPPRWWSPVLWAARTFNAVMWLRNYLVDPPFIMYYLTFMLPGVERILRRHGFDIDISELGLEGMYKGLKLVIATRSAVAPSRPIDATSGESARPATTTEANASPVAAM
jgi:ubiquinone/menaquinone biosynthesis C-methylase UbiE